MSDEREIATELLAMIDAVNRKVATLINVTPYHAVTSPSGLEAGIDEANSAIELARLELAKRGIR